MVFCVVFVFEIFCYWFIVMVGLYWLGWEVVCWFVFGLFGEVVICLGCVFWF